MCFLSDVRSFSRLTRSRALDLSIQTTHYERTIETMNTGMGLAFFEMRGRDDLQAGTPLHFPVPGEVLLSGGFDIYTFGGSTGTAGEDFSISGWR